MSDGIQWIGGNAHFDVERREKRRKIMEHQKEKIKNGGHGMLVTYRRPKADDHPLRDNHDDYDEHPK